MLTGTNRAEPSTVNLEVKGADRIAVSLPGTKVYE